MKTKEQIKKEVWESMKLHDVHTLRHDVEKLAWAGYNSIMEVGTDLVFFFDDGYFIRKYVNGSDDGQYEVLICNYISYEMSLERAFDKLFEDWIWQEDYTKEREYWERVKDFEWDDEKVLNFARIAMGGAYGSYTGCGSTKSKLHKFKELNTKCK